MVLIQTVFLLSKGLRLFLLLPKEREKKGDRGEIKFLSQKTVRPGEKEEDCQVYF